MFTSCAGWCCRLTREKDGAKDWGDDERFVNLAAKVQRECLYFDGNGLFQTLRFLKHFHVHPSPATVQALTSSAIKMLEWADDKDLVPSLTALASFGPCEATPQLMPKLRDLLYDKLPTMSLGGVVAVCLSFSRLGYDPGKPFHEAAMEAATPNLAYLKAPQALSFLTSLRVDARIKQAQAFLPAFTNQVASHLIDKLSFESLPEFLHKYTEIPGFTPDEEFISLLDRVSYRAAPRLHEWNQGHVLRCISSFLHFNYRPKDVDVFESFRDRTERLLISEWASGKNAVMLTTYFGRLSCRQPGGLDPPSDLMPRGGRGYGGASTVASGSPP